MKNSKRFVVRVTMVIRSKYTVIKLIFDIANVLAFNSSEMESEIYKKKKDV